MGKSENLQPFVGLGICQAGLLSKNRGILWLYALLEAGKAIKSSSKGSSTAIKQPKIKLSAIAMRLGFKTSICLTLSGIEGAPITIELKCPLFGPFWGWTSRDVIRCHWIKLSLIFFRYFLFYG